MLRFHHIGLFVKDIDYGFQKLSQIISVEEVGELFIDDNLLVKVLFVKDLSGVAYELVAPYGDGNPVDGVLMSKKNILNHVAYISDNFERDILDLRKSGCIPLGPPKNAKAFNGAKVIFFLTALGFIYELIEGQRA
jgi:methylmalonyl-CoA/ethylmalonyl-CoA epimerase